MGIYNFEPRFIPFIERGEKTHTIRAIRKYPDKPGNTMHLYTGLRHKGARLLGRFKCVKVEKIRIAPYTRLRGCCGAMTSTEIWIDGQKLDRTEKRALARRDGFEDFADMMKYWDGRLPFTGHVYHWTLA